MVAVNKMDTIIGDEFAYTNPRFHDIKRVLLAYLKKVGYKVYVHVVPISGGQGKNIKQFASLGTTYDGPTLL